MTDVDENWHIIMTGISDIIDDMCPLKSMKLKDKGKPWYTKELMERIHDKDLMRKRAKKNDRTEDWELAKRFRNETNRAIRNAKSDYIKESIEKNANDAKQFWKKINSILPSHSKGSSTINLIDTKLNKPVPREQTATYINNFFSTIGPNLAKKFKDPWIYEGSENEATLDNMSTTIDEVIKLCKEIDVNKSSAMENLPSKVIKDAFLAIPEIITKLMNLSLSSGSFPFSWKIANIIPIPKNGDSSDVNNLRPISLLPLPGKILEKIVHQRIYEFLKLNNLINPNQGGFQPGYSTTDTVAKLTDDIMLQANRGRCTLATFVDLKKAFDTVNREILTKKLEHLGIRNKNLVWIKSYLSERRQRTMANGTVSDDCSVNCGVPQGSILGPLFFLAYINDINVKLKFCNAKLFADDTVLYVSSHDTQLAHTMVQADLNRLSQWCNVNQLTVNVKKTKSVLFGTKKYLDIDRQPNLTLNNESIEYITHYKYLGIELDNNLNYKLHANNVYNLVAHKIYLLSKIRGFVSNKVALLIYKTKILPYLDYGDIFYMNTNIGILNKRQKLQNKALKICINPPWRTETDMVHNYTKIAKLDHRRTCHLRNFIHKRRDKEIYIDNTEFNTRRRDAVTGHNLPDKSCVADTAMQIELA